MTIGYGTFACILLSFCLSACNLSPRRPAAVPASATYVDHTFIECSFVQHSNANLCTVYKADTGEILVEVTRRSHRVAPDKVVGERDTQ